MLQIGDEEVLRPCPSLWSLAPPSIFKESLVVGLNYVSQSVARTTKSIGGYDRRSLDVNCKLLSTARFPLSHRTLVASSPRRQRRSKHQDSTKRSAMSPFDFVACDVPVTEAGRKGYMWKVVGLNRVPFNRSCSSVREYT